MTIDTHAHIDMEDYDDDRQEVIQRAFESGVQYIINIGCDIESCYRSVELTERYEFIYAAAGIHPHDVKSINGTTYDELRGLLAHPKVIALGETGLDFYKNYSPQDVQLTHFRKQVELAKELSKPLIIHSRDAKDDTTGILSDYYEDPNGKAGIFHCFSGDQEMADRALAMGFYISFSGVVTFKNAEALRAVAKTIPADRLFAETDCPYLSPVPMRGKSNEPAYVHHTAERGERILNDELHYEYALALFRSRDWASGQGELAKVSDAGPYGKQKKLRTGMRAFAVQVGAFASEGRAQTQAARLKSASRNSSLVPVGNLYVVQSTPRVSHRRGRLFDNRRFSPLPDSRA